MLILSRKKGESILIDNETEITILEVSGDKVRIGIDAPKSVNILRSELKKTVEENKSAACAVTPSKLAELLKHKDEP